jgi:hypothetical protein
MIDDIRVGRIKRDSWLLRNEILLWQLAEEVAQTTARPLRCGVVLMAGGWRD